jgi:hypothetical protein
MATFFKEFKNNLFRFSKDLGCMPAVNFTI